MTSVGVIAPVITTRPVSSMLRVRWGSVPGLTRNSAPASAASSA